MRFNYYYGAQADQFSFVRIPRIMLTDQLLASIKEKDARIKEIEALRQHIFDYSKTRKIYLEYKRLPKAKKAEFYELHRAEIELQEAARAVFDQLPEGTKLHTVKELNTERTRLIQGFPNEHTEAFVWTQTLLAQLLLP